MTYIGESVALIDDAMRSLTNIIHIDATDADIAAMTSLFRRGVRFGNENAELDTHLYDLIPKPWGQEYRAYADDLLDVWHLQINPGHMTSMHAHPRKTTYLLCLSGMGSTKTLGGSTEFTAGAILRIGRGAFHSTENVGSTEPLMLLEVETPRNKYDLMRLRDDYARSGTGYETVAANLHVAPKKIPFLPNGWMRRGSSCGNYAFDILSGMDVHYRRRSAGTYLVPLGIADLVNDQMDILTDSPNDTRGPRLDGYYLSIQRVA